MTFRVEIMRWVVTLVGVQFLCAIAWVLGPLLPIFEPWPMRAVLIMAMLLTWAAANLVLDWRRSRRDVALAAGLTGAAQDEATAVSDRLAMALKLMRKGGGALYKQPWYAIIGPPGAGKTTALLNAGLEFPLAAAIGAGAVAGVGGTRLCDWWFTRDAVLIDTAGRYTTQDSNQAVDRAGWQAFLALLRRTRPRCPLNGVLVAIALDGVVGPAGVAHATTIRARIDELDQTFGLRLPVYLLLTKADLLIGFTEFFADLDRMARQQVWGETFPSSGPHRGPPVPDQVLRPLLDRLNRRLLARLDAEDSPEHRALIAGFPTQYASVLPAVQAFVATCFAPDASGRTPMLRGAYLTSGTQEGTPIDRLTGALARAFGLEQRRPAALRPESGRAYFLADVLKRVVFPEAMLVAYRPGAAARRRVARTAGFASCALLLAGSLTWLATERADERQGISRAEAVLSNHSAQAAMLPLDPVADADTLSVLPWLNAARIAAEPGRPPRDPLGFAQHAKLTAGLAAAYRHALEFALFPRLVWRAETQVRGALAQPEALYEATRLYLMLGSAGPLDRDLVRDWFVRDWAATLPGDALAGARAALAQHLASLLQEQLPPVPLDGPLVQQARGTISRVPLAQRAYSRLKPQAAAHQPPPWRPSDALGPAGVRVFIRLSGQGLEDGIPGLFTAEGFRSAVLPALPHAADAALAEQWVLGEAVTPMALGALEAAIVVLYATDYAAYWDAMLADLDPAPTRSLTQAAQDFYILASPYSPMRTLLAAAATELAPAAGLPADTPGREQLAAIDERFRPIRSLFGTGGAAPIDQVMRPLADLQQQLAKQAATTTKPPAPAEDPAVALRAEARRQPQPLSRWLLAIATGGAALRDGGPRGAMVLAWNAAGAGGALCPVVITAKYPFVAEATAEATLDEFTRLLGPGGAIDAFINAQLKPYIDTTTRPWKLQAVDGVAAPVTAADLAQFQRAAAIRDLFFPAASPRLQVRFDLAPGTADGGADGARLEIAGVTIIATRDAPARPASLTWPGAPGQASVARLTIASIPPLQIDATGPWAPFRLLSRARFSPAGDKVALLFGGAGQQVRFTLRATPNPFNTSLLTDFRCPAVQ